MMANNMKANGLMANLMVKELNSGLMDDDMMESG